MSFEVRASEKGVEVVVDDFREFVETYSSRISRDGVFIETSEQLGRGQVADVEMRLADGFVLIRAKAMVAWNRGLDDALGRPQGIGLHFLEIDPDCSELLDRIVAEHEEQGGLVFGVDREAPSAGKSRGATSERLHSIVADREGRGTSLEGISGRAKGAIDVMPEPEDAGFAPGMERGGHDETLPEMGDKLTSMLSGAGDQADESVAGSEVARPESDERPPDREMDLDDLDSAFDVMIEQSDAGASLEASPDETSNEAGEVQAAFETVMVKDIDFDALKPPEMQPGDSTSSADSAAASDQAAAADAAGEQDALDDPLPEGDGIEHLSEPVVPIDVSGQLEMDKRLLDDGYLDEPGFWRSSSGVLVLIVIAIAVLIAAFLLISNLGAGGGEADSEPSPPAAQSAPEDADPAPDQEPGDGEASSDEESTGRP